MDIFNCLSLVSLLLVVFAYTDVINGATIDEIIMSATEKSNGTILADLTSDKVLQELDMMLTADQYSTMENEIDNQKFKLKNKASRKKRKAKRNLVSQWPNKVVPYKITGNVFTSTETQEIYKAFDEWRNFTCIQFREATSKDKHYVIFVSEGGCWSHVGRLGNQPNMLSLDRGCRSKKIIVHEIGHAIGFYHEQSRPDRDEYISVLEENIKDGASYNLQRKSWGAVATYGVPYDYTSVMHYGEKFFSKNEQPTIVTKDPKYQKIIGTSQGLSFNDIKLANRMYSCSSRCPNVKCPGQGFLGKDCQCWCPGDPVQLCSRTTTTLSPVRSTDPCSDQSEYCPAWETSGHCVDSNLVRKLCKKSCKTCNIQGKVICEDSKELNCPLLRKFGQCLGIFANHIAIKCPLSCSVCKA